MPSEQDIALQALQTALKMEVDGKEFYLQASRASTNKIGQELLKKLAGEEDVHREVFQKIYNQLKESQDWPEAKYTGDNGKNLQTVFTKALKAMQKNAQTIPSEMDAIKTAMDLENKTYDFYTSRSQSALFNSEKQLYESIAMQERVHQKVLQDYYDFLKDPAQWYVKAEHTSVDGG
jgi:rubrerythrin